MTLPCPLRLRRHDWVPIVEWFLTLGITPRHRFAKRTLKAREWCTRCGRLRG